MTRSITVAPGQTMSEVLNALKIGAGDDLVIEIPADASVLLTANEFRALAIAGERDDVEVSIYTDDPLRRQLASLFGVPLVNEIPEPQPYQAPELEPETKTEVFAPGGEFGVGEDDTAFPDDTEVSRNKRESGGGLAKAFGALVGIALLGVLVVGLYWLFLSSMTVDLHLTRQKVASTLAYQVTQPGVSVDSVTSGGIILQGQPVQFTLSRSLSAPVTGQTIIPDKAAHGSVTLRNPTDTAISIEKGMEFQGFDGAIFVFDETVDVPATTDDQPGEATANVSSPAGGEAGNQELGMLTGRLPNGVYYSNRMSEISGGTQKVVTTVAQSDLDQLRAEIDKELLALATTTELDNGYLLVPSTVQPTETNGTPPTQSRYVFSKAVGDEASEVNITATITFAGTAYDPAAVMTAAIPQLQAEVAAGQTFDPDSVHVNTPAETGQTDGVISLLATVAGDAIPTLDAAAKDALAKQLAGRSTTEVHQIVSHLDYADHATVSFSPSWLPDRVPSSAGRISVESN